MVLICSNFKQDISVSNYVVFYLCPVARLSVGISLGELQFGSPSPLSLMNTVCVPSGVSMMTGALPCPDRRDDLDDNRGTPNDLNGHRKKSLFNIWK